MLVHSSKDKDRYLMAKVNFLNQADLFFRKLHCPTLW